MRGVGGSWPGVGGDKITGGLRLLVSALSQETGTASTPHSEAPTLFVQEDSTGPFPGAARPGGAPLSLPAPTGQCDVWAAPPSGHAHSRPATPRQPRLLIRR